MPFTDGLYRTHFRAMAADHELVLAGGDDAQIELAAERAVADVERIEAKYSRYRDDSVTARINRAAGGTPVAIDAETAALLRYADACFAQSGGRFDLTSGVLRAAWDFKRRPPRVPDATVLAAAVARIGWRDVEWSEQSVRLPRVGMEIDFGGVGKEYAADRMATICIEAGIAHGCVNLGGDVRVWGGRPDGRPWRVGIRHPRQPDGVVGGLDVADGAIATSGDYERYFEVDGRRYCHIIDPHTGMPVQAWQSVSVVAPLAIVAGSYATIAMLLEDAAIAFLREQGVGYLAVASDGSVHGDGTSGTSAGSG
jgi:thiamine biosynthesis lipoprotein